MAQHGITWKFIAPRAAWWGGWWERMVGTMKRCLRKLLGQSRLTEEQVNNTLISTEAAVNSRTITQGEDSAALTPAHFLIGEGLATIPRGSESKTRQNLAKEFRLKQKLSKDFWKRWTKEYLIELRNFHEVQRPVRQTTQIRLGDVVLIQEDKAKIRGKY
jgi:selenocysteine-specific translation elongation factor